MIVINPYLPARLRIDKLLYLFDVCFNILALSSVAKIATEQIKTILPVGNASTEDWRSRCFSGTVRGCREGLENAVFDFGGLWSGPEWSIGRSDLLYPSRLVFEKSARSWSEKMLFSIWEHSNPAPQLGRGWERLSGIRTRHRHFGERVGMKSSLRLCAKVGIDVPVEGASRLPRSRRFSGLAAL